MPHTPRFNNVIRVLEEGKIPRYTTRVLGSNVMSPTLLT
jgi:hypothetical protein